MGGESLEAASESNPLHVRDASLGELDEVSAVNIAAYSEYAASFSREVWEAYASNVANVRERLGESELIVAERNGTIIGAVTFYPDASLSAVEGWPPGYSGIRLLAVRPEARGRGVARALMSECLRRSRERGVRYVGLHTTEVMAVARGMYERMGFKRAPQFDIEPIPGRVVMAYHLGL